MSVESGGGGLNGVLRGTCGTVNECEWNPCGPAGLGNHQCTDLYPDLGYSCQCQTGFNLDNETDANNKNRLSALDDEVSSIGNAVPLFSASVSHGQCINFNECEYQPCKSIYKNNGCSGGMVGYVRFLVVTQRKRIEFVESILYS